MGATHNQNKRESFAKQSQQPNQSPENHAMVEPQTIQKPSIPISVLSCCHNLDTALRKELEDVKQYYKFQQPNQLPESHAVVEPQTTQKPSIPIPVLSCFHNSDTVLGKEFEDVKLHYNIGKELGRGRFGITYLCTEILTGREYACKSYSKGNLSSKADKEDIKREIQTMQHLSGQPNIVDFKGAYEDENSIHLVMELCEGGELFEQIIARGHYSERAAASICQQIVNVVQICHFMGVMHRDLKPENFLLSTRDVNSLLKMADFGSSIFIEEGKNFDPFTSNLLLYPQKFNQ